MTALSRREQILNTANKLIHSKGFNKTSIADIANTIGITKGNLQYHFRSKDDLLVAVVDLRMKNMGAALQRFENQHTEPMARLRRIVRMVSGEEEGLTNSGCSIGSINVELGKCQRPLQQKSLEMFEQLRQWIESAFAQLDTDHARALSMHMLTMIQGAALLSYVYQDGELLQQECNQIDLWLDTLKFVTATETIL